MSLVDAIDDARERDEQAHVRRMEEWSSGVAAIRRARQAIRHDPDILIELLDEHSSLGDLPYSVEGIDTVFIDRRIVAIVDGLDYEDMPDESVTLLKSGKASYKAIPVGRRQELHRDAICSTAVRVAVEYVSVLPLEEVEILMLADLLDRATGHIRAEPVLYLRTNLQALRTVNLERADAGALVERLGGHFDWSRKDGFRAINASAFGIDLA